MTSLIEISAYQNMTAAELYKQFVALSSEGMDSQQHESQKLAIIQALEKMMIDQSPRWAHKLTQRRSKKIQNALSLAGYGVLLTFGCFEQSIGSYLFGSTLFGLIPGITSIVLSIASIIYTLLDIFLFYAFEVSFLRRYMGISNDQSGEGLLNYTYLEQLESVITINELLEHRDTLEWDKAFYDICNDSKELFNQHLLDKQSRMTEYPRSWAKAILEYALVTFGAISSMADSYFMAKAAIVALHISFMGPLGVGLALCMVFSGLIFYYVMGAKSVGKIVNPDLQSFKALNKGLTLFHARYDHATPNPSVYSTLLPNSKSADSKNESFFDELAEYSFSS